MGQESAQSGGGSVQGRPAPSLPLPQAHWGLPGLQEPARHLGGTPRAH